MKIAYLTELTGTKREGGEHLAPKRLANSVQALGHETELFSFAKGIDTHIPDILKYAPYIRQLFVFPFIGRRMLKYLEEEYDVVHITSTTTTLLYKPKIPCIITIHGLLCRYILLGANNFPLWYKVFFNKYVAHIIWFFERISLTKVDHIIVIKEDTKSFLIEHGISAQKISLIPNGVDLTKFKDNNTLPKENIAIFVGRATMNKGLDTLIAAAPDIHGDIIVVTRLYDPSLVKEGKKVGIKFFIDISDAELANLYSKASVFVLPSLIEEQPLTILEAMASGLPVVTTTIGSGDIITNGKNGVIVPIKDPFALANAINNLFQDKEKASFMGQLNRSIVERFYSWDRIAARVLSVYSQKLSG